MEELILKLKNEIIEVLNLEDIKPEDIAQHVIEAVEYNVKHQTKATKLSMVRKARGIEKEATR